MYKSKDVQGPTKFTGKRFDQQIAQADDAQNKTFSTTSRRREIGKQVETQDGNPHEDRRAGRPSPLPKGGAR